MAGVLLIDVAPEKRRGAGAQGLATCCPMWVKRDGLLKVVPGFGFSASQPEDVARAEMDARHTREKAWVGLVEGIVEGIVRVLMPPQLCQRPGAISQDQTNDVVCPLAIQARERAGGSPLQCLLQQGQSILWSLSLCQEHLGEVVG